jgi:IS30 family transposase
MLIFVPRPKVTKMAHITEEQRYTISRMQQAGCTRKEICIAIGKDKSVLSGELKRNAGKKGGYYPAHAQMLTDERKVWKKHPRKFTQSMEKLVRKYMEEDQWSPEQIVGYCGKEKIPMVSHERIYHYIRADKAAGGTLYKHTRHRLKKHKRPVGGGKKVTIKHKVSIDERPEIINNRGRFGDWEIDTIIGKEGKGAILTLTERQTSFLLMEKLPKGKNAQALAKTVVRRMFGYKRDTHSITADNGTEFAEHEFIAKYLKLNFFFAHPYSSYERGLKENTNGLIRQYIPKGSDFNDYSDDYIQQIQNKLNRRPRKKLGFRSPFEVFSLSLQ